MSVTLQAEQAGADAAQAQVQVKQAQEAAAAATRMRKLLDKRMTAMGAKAQVAAQVGLVHACHEVLECASSWTRGWRH